MKILSAFGQTLIIALIAAMVALACNNFRKGSLPLIGDWSPSGRLASSGIEGDLIISLEEAEVMYYSGQGVFLDARPEATYLQGHIKGARSLPWMDFEDRVSQVLADLPMDEKIVTYCDGDTCSLSKELALALLSRGYSQVRVLYNGWLLWQQAGLPVE